MPFSIFLKILIYGLPPQIWFPDFRSRQEQPLLFILYKGKPKKRGAAQQQEGV
jgi:hypothetical protein